WPPTSLRATFAALDRLAPDLAAERATRLWCTPPGNPGRRKDFRPRPGQIDRVRTERGAELVVESWGEGPVVHLVHGWGGWRGQLGAFVAPLVAAGYRVVAFDAPGHGESEPGLMGPGQGNVLDAVEGLAAVGRAFGPAAGMVAHSMGCTAAVVVAREHLAVGRLALIAPNEDFARISYGFAQAIGVTERTRSRLQARLEALCERPVDGFDLGPLGADGGLPDPLVIHDRQDKETPYAVGVRIAGSWPNARFLTTSGLGHQRILADDGVVASVVEHLTRPDGS
uniref:alpha/beta fold hydrolase n=1 Tax=Actinotalea sp. C106 TaxID=2908644 RepID=UPI00202933C4